MTAQCLKCQTIRHSSVYKAKDPLSTSQGIPASMAVQQQRQKKVQIMDQVKTQHTPKMLKQVLVPQQMADRGNQAALAGNENGLVSLPPNSNTLDMLVSTSVKLPTSPPSNTEMVLKRLSPLGTSPTSNKFSVMAFLSTDTALENSKHPNDKVEPLNDLDDMVKDTKRGSDCDGSHSSPQCLIV